MTSSSTDLILASTTKTRFKDVLTSVCNAITSNQEGIQEFKHGHHHRFPLRLLVGIYLQKEFRSDDKNPCDTITLITKDYPVFFAKKTPTYIKEMLNTYSQSDTCKKLALAVLNSSTTKDETLKNHYDEIIKSCNELLRKILHDIIEPLLDNDEDIKDFISFDRGSRCIAVRNDKIPVSLVPIKVRTKKINDEPSVKRTKRTGDQIKSTNPPKRPRVSSDGTTIIPSLKFGTVSSTPSFIQSTPSINQGSSSTTSTPSLNQGGAPSSSSRLSMVTVQELYDAIDSFTALANMVKMNEQVQNTFYNRYRNMTMDEVVRLYGDEATKGTAQLIHAIFMIKSHVFA
jgi:hypothetical protein